MARIRTIKPEFPQSESMGRISRDARLTFVMLWTIADDEGRLRGNSRMLASLLFPYDDDAGRLISGWLDELDREGCIVQYKIGSDTYIEICNWCNHQRIDRPGQSKIPAPDESSRILANTREPSCEDQGRDQGRDQGSKDHPPLPPTGGVAEVAVKEKKKAKPRGRSYDIEALHLTETDEAEAMKVWNAWPQTGWNFSTKTEAPRRINKALFLERFSEILRHSPIRKADDSKLTSEDLAGAAIKFVEYRKKEARQNGSTIPNVPCIANFFSSVENEKNPWKDAVLAYFEV